MLQLTTAILRPFQGNGGRTGKDGQEFRKATCIQATIGND